MAHPEIEAAGPFPAGWTEELEQFFGPVSGLFSSGGGFLARSYLLGLLLPGERKSVQPIATRLDVSYEALQHIVNDSPWRDHELLGPVRASLADRTASVPLDERVLGIDDTGFLKRGTASVGVQRQYTGTAGKTTNCQIAVGLTYAWWPAGALGPAFSCPLSWWLYLPASWAKDNERRKRAKVPESAQFLKKWEMALEQLDEARKDGIEAGIVEADAAYGDCSAFRAGLRERGYAYSVGLTPANQTVLVEATGEVATPEELAASLDTTAWTYIAWREAHGHELGAHFARLTVRVVLGGNPTDERAELLLERRSDGELKAHCQHGLSHLPLAVAAERARRRWVCEQVFQQAKEELGVDHFEGRSWRGWHHHTTFETVAHTFLALERYQEWIDRHALKPGATPPPR